MFTLQYGGTEYGYGNTCEPVYGYGVYIHMYLESGPTFVAESSNPKKSAASGKAYGRVI